MNTHKGRRWLLGSGLLVAAVVLAVGGWLLARGWLPARLMDREPAAGARDVPITTSLRLTWSRALDLAQARGRLRFEPEVEGELLVDGRMVIYRPRVALSPDTTYTVTLQGGPDGQDRSWQFHTRAPRLLYLAHTAPGDGPRQLFVAEPGETAPRQLTDHPLGVWDYAVHPLGQAIVYSAVRDDGGTDLWQVRPDGQEPRLLLACPGEACLNPAWSPLPAGGDGAGQLAFERRGLWAGGPNLDPRAGRLWLLDLPALPVRPGERDEARPLFDYEVALHAPAWAPDGARLAYASPTLPGVEVLTLATGDLFQLGNQWGAAPAWSPDGRFLALPDLLLAGESLLVHLARVEVSTEQILDLSGEESPVKDEGPAWSPGGGWIAFSRQWLSEERWTPGRQIWLVRPDGSEAYPLLEEPLADHFSLAWRPDGGALAYARTDLGQEPGPVPDVSVWIYDLLRRERLQVAQDAVLPRWLP